MSIGLYQSACAIGEYIYRSTDFGVTWAQSFNLSAGWIDIALSSTGQYQTVVDQTQQTGYIYRSTDYGVLWTLVRSNITSRSISISSTGKYQTVAANSGIIRSNDFGVTWTQVGPATLWTSVSVN